MEKKKSFPTYLDYMNSSFCSNKQTVYTCKYTCKYTCNVFSRKIAHYGLKSLICHLADLRKKSRICRKRKARTSWDIHTLTRNAHQLYNIVSIISAKKIHFARPKDDFTFTQTSRSLKLFNPLCQLSLADLSQTITAFSTYYGLMKAVVYVVVEEERLWFRSLFTRETNGENALTSVFVAEI